MGNWDSSITSIPEAKDSVKIDNKGVIKVYCVECDGWRHPSYQTMAFVEFDQFGHKRFGETDFSQGQFLCGFCDADVDYTFGLNPEMAIRFLKQAKG